MKLDYFEIVKRAWQIIWKHKYLWVFGFIIALAAGGSNFSNSLNYSFNGADTQTASSSFSGFMAAYAILLIFIGLIMVLFGLVVWILSILATGGLIGSAAKIERGEETSLRDGFRIGAKNFWRILGLNIIVGLIIFCLVIALIVPLVVVIVSISSAGDQGGGMVAGLICFILIIILAVFLIALVAWALSIITLYAVRYIVLEGQGVFASFRSGWGLIRKKPAETFFTFLIVLLISAIAGSVFSIPSLLVGVPVFLTLLAGVATQNIGLVLLAVVGFVLLSLAMSFFNGVLEAYRSVVWTLTFMKIGNGGAGLPALPPEPKKPATAGKPQVPMVIEKPATAGKPPAPPKPKTPRAKKPKV
jgi:hypothetical protein